MRDLSTSGSGSQWYDRGVVAVPERFFSADYVERVILRDGLPIRLRLLAPEDKALLRTGFEAAIQLFIDPNECIDCGACEPECPVNAIYPEDDVPAEYEEYIAKNAAAFE